MKSISWSNL